MSTSADQNSTARARRLPVREAPHGASRYDAGTGQGTLFTMPKGELLEHPVLDGSTENRRSQRATENPYRGRRDPALGEWNYAHANAPENDMKNEPLLKRIHEAEAAVHASEREPRHWYKYDPDRVERNRLKGYSEDTTEPV